jgi:hypothetical protein
VQVQAVYLCTTSTTFRKTNLIGLYSCICFGYEMLMALYGAIAVTSNWKQYAKLTYQRSVVMESANQEEVI